MQIPAKEQRLHLELPRNGSGISPRSAIRRTSAMSFLVLPTISGSNNTFTRCLERMK
jgi:hypothetical protein